MTVDQQPPAPPLRERGYTQTGSGDFWGSLQSEKTAELRWPMSLAVYEDMDDQDGQVGSTFAAVTTPILRAGWRLAPNGARDEVVEHVARDLDIPIVGESTVDEDGNEKPQPRRRGRFSLQEHHAVAVPDHLQFGHAVFEQVYFPPDANGRLHLRKLGYRPPRTIAAFNVARDGGLVSVQQYAPGSLAPGIGVFTMGQLGVTLPVNRLVVYTHRRKGSNWLGKSVFRSAYKNWVLKDRLLRLQAQVAERNGMGIPKYTAASQTDVAEIERGLELAAALRAGDDSGLSLPNGAELELMGVTGTLVDLLGPIRYHDEQIARSMLANVLNLGQNRGTGSWSLGTTLQDVLSLSIESITEGVRDTENKHIVEDIVSVNWGEDEPSPRLVVDEIGSKNDAIVQAIAQMVDAGVLRPDENLETFIRTTLGVPPYGGAAIESEAS